MEWNGVDRKESKMSVDKYAKCIICSILIMIIMCGFYFICIHLNVTHKIGVKNEFGFL